MKICLTVPLSTTCVTKHGTNNHDNEHGKDEHEVGAKHTLALLMMVMTNKIKEETKTFIAPKQPKKAIMETMAATTMMM